MKYIIGVLCVTYLPAYAFAEQLQDNTNVPVPNIPDMIDSKSKNTQIKMNEQEQDNNVAQLFLNISINSNPSEDLVAVRQDQDKKLYIRARDLKTLRLKMDDSISDSQWICLNELKDIRFKYLENEQSLNLQVPPHMMTGYSVDLKGQQITSPQLLKIKPLNAAILNYSLYHTITNDENVFSGSAEGIFNSAIGNFSSGVLYNGNDKNSYSHEKWVRLESKWQYVDPEKGIGAAVCHRFAKEGLKVYVAGRTFQKIEAVAAEIHANAGEAVAFRLDAEDINQVQALFDTIISQNERITAVIHNVGGNIPSIFLRSPLSFFTQMWQSTFLSAYLVSQSCLKIFKEQNHGTLIFTGASASLRGKPFFAAFTMGKSALRTYALNLAQIYKTQGIHIAHVIIDGMVDGDRINKALFGLGRFIRLTRGTGGLNINAIADNYWMLYQQSPELWTHELDLRPYQE